VDESSEAGVILCLEPTQDHDRTLDYRWERRATRRPCM